MKFWKHVPGPPAALGPIAGILMVIAVLLFTPGLESTGTPDIGIGVKIGLPAGLGAVVSVKLTDNISLNISVGTGPSSVGTVIRAEFNAKYLFAKDERWSPFIQGGLGYFTVLYNEYGQQVHGRVRYDLIDVHASAGMSWSFLPSFSLSADIGLLYGIWANIPPEERWWEGIPIAPSGSLQCVYTVK